MAVLPMPSSPSPMRTGLFLVRRERMRTTQQISSSPDDRIKVPGLLHEAAVICLEHLEVGVPRRGLHAPTLTAAELPQLDVHRRSLGRKGNVDPHPHRDRDSAPESHLLAAQAATLTDGGDTVEGGTRAEGGGTVAAGGRCEGGRRRREARTWERRTQEGGGDGKHTLGREAVTGIWRMFRGSD
jgi:hypothetical protein